MNYLAGSVFYAAFKNNTPFEKKRCVNEKLKMIKLETRMEGEEMLHGKNRYKKSFQCTFIHAKAFLGTGRGNAGVSGNGIG